eukprot:6480959-Amphidinium_carterae.1
MDCEVHGHTNHCAWCIISCTMSSTRGSNTRSTLEDALVMPEALRSNMTPCSLLRCALGSRP